MNEEPTREDLLAVLAYARRFDETDFVAGEWVSPETREGGALQVGYWRPSEDVARWQAALYEHQVVLKFDWTDPEWTRQMRRYAGDQSLLEGARLLTIRKVLTTLVRADRFCEGTFAQAFERGVPQAAMRRFC